MTKIVTSIDKLSVQSSATHDQAHHLQSLLQASSNSQTRLQKESLAIMQDCDARLRRTYVKVDDLYKLTCVALSILSTSTSSLEGAHSAASEPSSTTTKGPPVIAAS